MNAPKPGKTLEQITLKTEDGVCLYGEHRIASKSHIGQKIPKATVIAIHGFTAHTHQEDFAALLNILDYPEMDQIAYDTRGHGQSDGEATFGNKEYLDIEAAMELALLQDAPILLVGVSAGAVSIVHYLYRGDYPKEIAGVMLVSCPAYWKGRFGISSLYMSYLTQTKSGRTRLASRHNVTLALPIQLPIAPIDAIDRIKVPVAIASGTGDKLLGSMAPKLLYEKANSPKRLELAFGARHGPSNSLGQAAKRGFEWLVDQI